MSSNSKSMRNLIEKYEKWLMLGLVIFLLMIFTITGDITDALSGEGEDAPPSGKDLAGSFMINPKRDVKISYTKFERAKASVRVGAFLRLGAGSREDAGDLGVWAHLILVEAARDQGVVVSDEVLVDRLRSTPGLGALMTDKAAYTNWCRNQHHLSRLDFEEAVRDAMIAARVRQLYWDTYFVAPPATREELVSRYGSGSSQFVDATWAALDASSFREQEESALGDAKDATKLLKEFFEKDPAVKEDALQFRHSRRFQFEMLYANHERLTVKNFEAAKKMFFAAWPEYAETESKREIALDFGGEDEIRRFWTSYQSRLIKAEGKTMDDLREQAKLEVAKTNEAAPAKDESKNPDEEKDPKADPKDSNKAPDEAPNGGVASKELEELARKKAVEKALERIGKQICRDRIIRELELRRIFRLMHNDAYDNPKDGLRRIYDRLLAVDDKNAPLCSTEPNKGLFVLLQPKDALSQFEIESLKDGEHRFGPNVAFRVSGASREKLPFVRKSAEVLGPLAEGRMIVRVMSSEPERRKTFAELDAPELEVLKGEFYLPHMALARAKLVLQELKKKMDDGKVAPDGFRVAAESLGARVVEQERIVASSESVQQPDESLLFPPEYLHMRDRAYLRTRLASVLASDRIKDEKDWIQDGTWLDVQTRSDTEEAETDPGTAYLLLLIKREKPDATTIPEKNLSEARSRAANQMLVRDRIRWEAGYQQLFKDFDVKFVGPMKDAVEADFARLAEKR